ncbi:hypothetical protein AMECASPLE_028290 [Ameca splendens]|uniref:Uncharacterized protein n=1 Tax=Ameca splendens TaxID=208324 RepID=A0ABV0YH69_9TELE
MLGDREEKYISKFQPQRRFNKLKQQFDGACLGPGNNCRLTRKGSGETVLTMDCLFERVLAEQEGKQQ